MISTVLSAESSGIYSVRGAMAMLYDCRTCHVGCVPPHMALQLWNGGEGVPHMWIPHCIMLVHRSPSNGDQRCLASAHR